MAAISHVYTLSLAAEILGREEDTIWDLSDQMDTEDGVLWILDINDTETLAFTSRGLEVLQEFLDDQVESPS
ncbi:MAG: hypothetical protein HN377_10780 [Alphaproteobacteria bacterium]|jgi:hypothetical protein|nr:hypothetical protein [Alphaproteobacteria bacterium]